MNFQGTNLRTNAGLGLRHLLASRVSVSGEGLDLGLRLGLG